MKAPVDQGADAAIEFLGSIRDYVDCLPPLERAQWFCGFVNATAAWSMHSVGWHHTETMLLAAIEIVPKAKAQTMDLEIWRYCPRCGWEYRTPYKCGRFHHSASTESK